MDDLTAFEIRTVSAVARGTFHFDAVDYDADADVIHLASGPDAACVTERSPEGFLVRIDALENRVVGLEIDHARRRVFADDAPIEVTIAPGQRLAFDTGELRRLMSGGRFARKNAGDDVTIAKATAPKRFER